MQLRSSFRAVRSSNHIEKKNGKRTEIDRIKLFKKKSACSFRIFVAVVVRSLVLAKLQLKHLFLVSVGGAGGDGAVLEALRPVVGLAVGAVDFTGLAGHVGQQLERVFVRRPQRQQPLLQPNFVLFSQWLKKKIKLN